MDRIEQLFADRGLLVASVRFDEVAIAPIPEAKTVLIAALPYRVPKKKGQNLADLAVMPDWIPIFREKLECVARGLRERFPNRFFRISLNDSPIDERKAAIRSGLAVAGKNGLCITAAGSRVFLGEIITDEELTLPTPAPIADCGDCRRCIDACPTAALTERGYDYRRCIGYLTQKPGELDKEEAALLTIGHCAWGCDACTDACPRNSERIEDRSPPAPYSPPPETLLYSLNRAEIEATNEAEFAEIYRNRAFAASGREILLRNLTILEEPHG